MKYISVLPDQTLDFQDVSKPPVGLEECLVRVKAFGINRADLLQRAGMYPPPKGESEILGLEVSGEVVALGKEVNSFKVGSEVFGLVPGGAYAEFVVAKASHLIGKPTSYSFEQAAATAETYLTAYQSLFTIAKLKAGDSVLIHAGASGVGTAAIQLAKSIGCFVVATVGSAKKLEACKKLGADIVLNYHDIDFQQWTKENHKTGFNVILDVVAGAYLNKNISVSALDGKIIILSMLGGRYSEQVDIAKMLLKRVTISASTLRNRSDAYKSKLTSEFTNAFKTQIENGEILPLIDTVFSWQDIEKYHIKMSKNENIGKYVAVID